MTIETCEAKRLHEDWVYGCNDFEGSCCPSCHEDIDYGFPLPEIERSADLSVWARVCCRKMDQAKQELEKLEKINQDRIK